MYLCYINVLHTHSDTVGAGDATDGENQTWRRQTGLLTWTAAAGETENRKTVTVLLLLQLYRNSRVLNNNIHTNIGARAGAGAVVGDWGCVVYIQGTL